MTIENTLLDIDIEVLLLDNNQPSLYTIRYLQIVFYKLKDSSMFYNYRSNSKLPVNQISKEQ